MSHELTSMEGKSEINEGIVRVDTGIARVVSRRHFLPWLRRYEYEQPFDSGVAVLESVDPSIIECKVDYKGDGGRVIKLLPKGTKAVLQIGHTLERLREWSRFFYLGGVILDSDTPVSDGREEIPSYMINRDRPLSNYYGFELGAKIDHSSSEYSKRRAEDAQAFMKKRPDLLSQGKVQFELDRITHVKLIVVINEIIAGDFKNSQEFLAWLEPRIDGAWDIASNLRERLEKAGVLKKDEKKPDTLTYRQEPLQDGAHGNRYRVAFSDDLCEIATKVMTETGEGTVSFVFTRGRQLSYSESWLLYSNPYFPGHQSYGSMSLDRDGRELPSDPNAPVSIGGRVKMFDEFKEMCDKIANSALQETTNASD